MHAHLYIKTGEDREQELWVTFDSLMVSLIKCERGVLQG